MSGTFDVFGLGADPDKPDESPARKAQLASARPLPKRFYAEVAVTEDDGFCVLLDGRPVRTPERHIVKLSVANVAEAFANEWREQETIIDPKTMPLTRLVNSAIDGVSDTHEAVRQEIVRFAGTDLTCYRADTPDRLVERQMASWDPVIKWAEKHYECHFTLVCGIVHASQPEETLKAIEQGVSQYDDIFRLASLHSMTTLMGSCLLALGVAEKQLDPQDAWRAAHIDEDWNIELWGSDKEAEARRAYRWSEMQAAAFLTTSII